MTSSTKISDDDITELGDQLQGDDEDSDNESSVEEIINPVVKKQSISAPESAIDALKDAAMFKDEGKHMKTLIVSFERLYCVIFQSL